MDQSRRVLTLWSWVRIPPEHEIHTNTSTGLFLRVDQWSSGRAVECDCPESSGVQAPGGRILPTPRTPHENRSHEGDYRGLAGVPPESQTLAWMVGLVARRSPAKDRWGGSPWRVRLSHHPLADLQ